MDFSEEGLRAKGWVPYTPQGPAATGPDPSTAPKSTPFAGPQDPRSKIGGATVGASFATRGLGRYFNNLNGGQFRNKINGPAIRNAAENALNAYGDAKFYRQQGMVEGLRGFLGMPQSPSHRSDDINARRNAALRGKRVVGLNPSASEEQEYEHW